MKKVSHKSHESASKEQHARVPKCCCLCMPNRFGLFVLALVKLVLSLGLLFIFFFTWFLSFVSGPPESVFHTVLLSIAILIIVGDIMIGSAALISICENDKYTLEIYNMYIFTSMIVLCCVVFCIISRDIGATAILFYLLFLILILVMQICLNHMVKKPHDEERSSNDKEKREVPVIVTH